MAGRACGAACLALWMLFGASPAQAQAGDPARGRQLAAECFACHGPDGNSPSPVNPKIGGQHESYLLLALKAYVDGSRSNSLMRGAVLNKSEQDLRDMAAYFASQKPAGSGPAGPPGAGAPGGGVVRFDHGERTAEFTGLLARARAALSEGRVGEDACAGLGGDGPAARDADGDGVPDRDDAFPADAGEFAADRNGDGRHEICTPAQLQAIAGDHEALPRAARLARDYQLARDLDMGGLGNFTPIGDCGPTGNCMRALGQFGFKGIFDGQGHVIRRLEVRHPERGGVGLVGVLGEGAAVLHLRLEEARVEGRAGTGLLVGSNFGVVYGCEAGGEVTARMAVGGLVGGSGGLVYGSASHGRVNGQQAVGGLVGDMTGAVYASRSSADVTGERGVGGLVGLNTFGSIQRSAASGTVRGTNDIGGLVGVNTDARVRTSRAEGRVSADGNNVGGLAGFNSLSTIRNSYALGAVSGADAVGGLVGRNNGVVERGFAAGAAEAAGQHGPITGAVVDGREDGVYASDLDSLTGEATGWAPVALPVTRLIDYFCDTNENGFIDPDERQAGNYIWQFGGRSGHPQLRCPDVDRSLAAR